MSAAFAGVAGAWVTVVPWGDHFAFFATDATGAVMTAGGDPQNGLMGPWAPMSDAFSGVAGAPVSVLPWGNHFALFAIDAGGVVSCAGGDPQNGLMGPWAPISDAFAGAPGAPVAVQPWGDHFALFATDATGAVMTAGGDPQNGLMGPWAPMSDAFSGVAGAPVSVLPWGNHFALFAIDAGGVVSCAGGDPQNGLMGPWAPISDAFAGAPGAPVAVQPWGDHFALFATDATGAVMTAGGDPQNGLMGPWAWVSEDFSGPPGAVVAAIPWAGAFAVCAVDSTGAVRTASGDPQNNLSDWTPALGLTAKPGSAATIVPIGTGVDLFAVDTTGAVFATGGGEQVMTSFTPGRHGWHFDNDFVNELLGGLITTYGLCGGMAYSSLDYYFNGIPIPTHRTGDFGGDPELTCPPDGRLRSMIFNRLIDSFTDNFDKWSCVYPELDAAVGAALGLVFGGGLIGGLVGAVDGWVYGELHEAFACPGGGAAGMTRQELPHLIKDFLDKGVPAPIGLIYDRDILHVGDSHQVVAYGYVVAGGQTLIYVYDNRFHDQECMLTIDTENPGKILETLVDGSALPDGNNGNWEGLLVSDGYQSQRPSYGQDIGIASPQALKLSGPVVMAPIAAGSGILARINGRVAGASPGGGAMPIVVAPQPQQPAGRQLVDSFAVQNFGEYQAHYQSLGIEIDAPDGGASFYDATAAGTDNLLAPGQAVAVTIDIDKFGDVPGIYALRAGYNSVPLNAESSDWLTLFSLAASVTVT